MWYEGGCGGSDEESVWREGGGGGPDEGREGLVAGGVNTLTLVLNLVCRICRVGDFAGLMYGLC